MAYYRSATSSLDAVRRAPSGSWGSPTTLDSMASAYSSAGGSGGDHAVAWIRAGLIYAARYRSETASWTTFGGTDDASTSRPAVGISGKGAILVVWTHGTSVRARRLVGSSWGKLVTLDSSGANPQLDVNDDGQAIATWHPTEAAGVRAAVFTPTSGWSPVATVSTVHVGGPASSAGEEVLNVGIDACGAGHVVFRPNSSTISAARYTPLGGWAAAVEIDGLPSSSYAVRMDTAPNGIAQVVWDYGSGSAIRAVRFE